MTFGVQNYTWANVESEQGQKVYVYRFTRKLPYTDARMNYRAFHTGEVPYAYDNLRFVNRPWEMADDQLASAMSSYWVNFITSADPNGKSLAGWPLYETGSKKIMELGSHIGAESIPDAASLDFIYD